MTAYFSDNERRARLAWRHRLAPVARSQDPARIAEDLVALHSSDTDRSGNIGPTVWADGRIVGGWAQRPDGSIATEVLHDLGLEHRRLLEVETGRLQEIVGPARFRARFPSPNQKDLLR